MGADEYDPLYLAGVEYFNARDFFEAHEVWEEIWAKTAGRDQLFYKGLIHAAVALHHFGNRNLRGAHKVWASCRHYLTPYAPFHLGLDVARFLEHMQKCFAQLEPSDSEPMQVELIDSQVPRITLDPPPDRECEASA